MPGKIRGLFRWCLKVIEGYEGIELVDMTSSWKNGLAFCAIINRFRPDLIDFYSLSPENVYENNDLAFSVMEKEFDIPRLLDPTDMVEMDSPDRYSIATYVSSFYECFNDKPMHDPPPVPENWTAKKIEIPKRRHSEKFREKNKERTYNKRQSFPVCLEHSMSSDNLLVQKNKDKGSDKAVDLLSAKKAETAKDVSNIKSKGLAQSGILSHVETKDVSKTKSKGLAQSGILPHVVEAEDCDIDDLYNKSVGLLDTREGNTNLDAEKQSSSYTDLCKNSIDDIKTSKHGVVLQAMVMAGVTAVAATTIGDDIHVDDDSEHMKSEEIKLENSNKCKTDQNDRSKTNQDQNSGVADALLCNTANKDNDSGQEFNPSDTVYHDEKDCAIDNGFRTDDSLADSGCDINSVLNYTTEPESMDLNNTLSNTLPSLGGDIQPESSHVEAPVINQEIQEQKYDLSASKVNHTSVDDGGSERDLDENKSANIETEDTIAIPLEMKTDEQSCYSGAISKQVVDVLNYELNNGNYKILDVDVVDDSGVDKTVPESDDSKSVPVESASTNEITESMEKADVKTSLEAQPQLHLDEDADVEKDKLNKQIGKTDSNVTTKNDLAKAGKTVERDTDSESSEEDLAKNTVGTDKIPKDTTVENKDVDVEGHSDSSSSDSESEKVFAESMATDIVNNVLDEIKSNPDMIDAGQDISSIMKEIETDLEVQNALQSSGEVENYEIQKENQDSQMFSVEEDSGDTGIPEEVKHYETYLTEMENKSSGSSRKNSSSSTSSQASSGKPFTSPAIEKEKKQSSSSSSSSSEESSDDENLKAEKEIKDKDFSVTAEDKAGKPDGTDIPLTENENGSCVDQNQDKVNITELDEHQKENTNSVAADESEQEAKEPSKPETQDSYHDINQSSHDQEQRNIESPKMKRKESSSSDSSRNSLEEDNIEPAEEIKIVQDITPDLEHHPNMDNDKKAQRKESPSSESNHNDEEKGECKSNEGTSREASVIEPPTEDNRTNEDEVQTHSACVKRKESTSSNASFEKDDHKPGEEIDNVDVKKESSTVQKGTGDVDDQNDKVYQDIKKYSSSSSSSDDSIKNHDQKLDEGIDNVNVTSNEDKGDEDNQIDQHLERRSSTSSSSGDDSVEKETVDHHEEGNEGRDDKGLFTDKTDKKVDPDIDNTVQFIEKNDEEGENKVASLEISAAKEHTRKDSSSSSSSAHSTEGDSKIVDKPDDEETKFETFIEEKSDEMEPKTSGMITENKQRKRSSSSSSSMDDSDEKDKHESVEDSNKTVEIVVSDLLPGLKNNDDLELTESNNQSVEKENKTNAETSTIDAEEWPGIQRKGSSSSSSSSEDSNDQESNQTKERPEQSKSITEGTTPGIKGSGQTVLSPSVESADETLITEEQNNEEVEGITSNAPHVIKRQSSSSSSSSDSSSGKDSPPPPALPLIGPPVLAMVNIDPSEDIATDLSVGLENYDDLIIPQANDSAHTDLVNTVDVHNDQDMKGGLTGDKTPDDVVYNVISPTIVVETESQPEIKSYEKQVDNTADELAEADNADKENTDTVVGVSVEMTKPEEILYDHTSNQSENKQVLEEVEPEIVVDDAFTASVAQLIEASPSVTILQEQETPENNNSINESNDNIESNQNFDIVRYEAVPIEIKESIEGTLDGNTKGETDSDSKEDFVNEDDNQNQQTDTTQTEVKEESILSVPVEIKESLERTVKPDKTDDTDFDSKEENEYEGDKPNNQAEPTETHVKEDETADSVLAVPVRMGEVKLDWSTKVSDSNGNIAKEVSMEFTAPISADGETTDVPEGKLTEKTFAEIDKDLLKKAAIMSRKMAEKVTMKILGDQNPDEEKDEGRPDNKEEVIDRTPGTPPPTPVPEQEQVKERRQKMFQFLQNSTRPTKKKFDTEDEKPDDKNLDFASKMKMWNRRSFTNAEPSRKVSIETAPKKRVSLSSPFLVLDNPNTAPLEKDTHMARLAKILPDKPAPGSVADYVRQISDKKSPTTSECPSFKSSLSRSDSDSASEKSFDGKVPKVTDKWRGNNTEQDNKDEDTNKETEPTVTKQVKPSSIFAVKALVRMRPKNPNLRLAVRPMSIEKKYQEEIKKSQAENNKSVDATKPPIPPARQSRRNSGRVNVEVKPLEPKLQRQDSTDDRDDKEELKRQDSLKKRSSPRRSISLSSPTRSRSSSGERDLNVWLDPPIKPPSPKLKRSDSFEVKIRPVTSQKSQEEKAEVKKEKEEIVRQNSLKSTRPPTPPKNNSKIDVSVKPVSALESNDQNKNEDPKPSQRKGRRSLLSLIESVKTPKKEESVVFAPDKSDALPPKIDVNITDLKHGIESDDGKNIETQDRQETESNVPTKKTVSKLYGVIRAAVKEDENRKSKETDNQYKNQSTENKKDMPESTELYQCPEDVISEEIVSVTEAKTETSVPLKNEKCEDPKESYQEAKENTIKKCNSIFGTAKPKAKDLEKQIIVDPNQQKEINDADVIIDDSAKDGKITKQKSTDKDSDSSSSSSDESSDEKSAKSETSLTSSAEIDRPEIKEDLKSIIKEIEDEIDTQEEKEFGNDSIQPNLGMEVDDKDTEKVDQSNTSVEDVPLKKVHGITFRITLNTKQASEEKDVEDNSTGQHSVSDNTNDVSDTTENVDSKDIKKKLKKRKKERCSDSSSESNQSDTDESDHDDSDRTESTKDGSESCPPSALPQNSTEERKISSGSGKLTETTESSDSNTSTSSGETGQEQVPNYNDKIIIDNKGIIDTQDTLPTNADFQLRDSKNNTSLIDDDVIEKHDPEYVSILPQTNEYVLLEPQTDLEIKDPKEWEFENIIKTLESPIDDGTINLTLDVQNDDNSDIYRTDILPVSEDTVKDNLEKTKSDTESSSSSSDEDSKRKSSSSSENESINKDDTNVAVDAHTPDTREHEEPYKDISLPFYSDNKENEGPSADKSVRLDDSGRKSSSSSKSDSDKGDNKETEEHNPEINITKQVQPDLLQHLPQDEETKSFIIDGPAELKTNKKPNFNISAIPCVKPSKQIKRSGSESSSDNETPDKKIKWRKKKQHRKSSSSSSSSQTTSGDEYEEPMHDSQDQHKEHFYDCLTTPPDKCDEITKDNAYQADSESTDSDDDCSDQQEGNLTPFAVLSHPNKDHDKTDSAMEEPVFNKQTVKAKLKLSPSSSSSSSDTEPDHDGRPKKEVKEETSKDEDLPKDVAKKDSSSSSSSSESDTDDKEDVEEKGNDNKPAESIADEEVGLLQKSIILSRKNSETEDSEDKVISVDQISLHSTPETDNVLEKDTINYMPEHVENAEVKTDDIIERIKDEHVEQTSGSDSESEDSDMKRKQIDIKKDIEQKVLSDSDKGEKDKTESTSTSSSSSESDDSGNEKVKKSEDHKQELCNIEAITDTQKDKTKSASSSSESDDSDNEKVKKSEDHKLEECKVEAITDKTSLSLKPELPQKFQSSCDLDEDQKSISDNDEQVAKNKPKHKLSHEDIPTKGESSSSSCDSEDNDDTHKEEVVDMQPEIEQPIPGNEKATTTSSSSSSDSEGDYGTHKEEVVEIQPEMKPPLPGNEKAETVSSSSSDSEDNGDIQKQEPEIKHTLPADEKAETTSASSESEDDDDVVLSDIDDLPLKKYQIKNVSVDISDKPKQDDDNLNTDTDDEKVKEQELGQKDEEQNIPDNHLIMQIIPDEVSNKKEDSASSGSSDDDSHEDGKGTEEKRQRRVSASSHSSSSSSSDSETDVEEKKTDADDVYEPEDDLLKTVIEDAQPFKAPILETVVSTEIASEDEKEEENVEIERTYSSDDLYTNDDDNKMKLDESTYLLPECNMIKIDYDDMPLKVNDLPYNILDFEYNPDPIDIQVFVIPDTPVDTPLPKTLESKDIMLLHGDKIAIPSDLPTEIADTIDNDNIYYDDLNKGETPFKLQELVEDDYLTPRQVKDIMLEPIASDVQTNVVSESEDELLKNIIQDQAMVPVRRRKSSTSSSSSSSSDDNHEGDAVNYDDLSDEHVYLSLEDDVKHVDDGDEDIYDDGLIYEDIDESQVTDFDFKGRPSRYRSSKPPTIRDRYRGKDPKLMCGKDDQVVPENDEVKIDSVVCIPNDDIDQDSKQVTEELSKKSDSSSSSESETETKMEATIKERDDNLKHKKKKDKSPSKIKETAKKIKDKIASKVKTKTEKPKKKSSSSSSSSSDSDGESEIEKTNDVDKKQKTKLEKKKFISKSGSSTSDSEIETIEKTDDGKKPNIKKVKEKPKLKTRKERSPSTSSSSESDSENDTKQSNKKDDVEKKQKMKRVKEKFKTEKEKSPCKSISSASDSEGEQIESVVKKPEIKKIKEIPKLKTVNKKSSSSSSSSESSDSECDAKKSEKKDDVEKKQNPKSVKDKSKSKREKKKSLSISVSDGEHDSQKSMKTDDFDKKRKTKKVKEKTNIKTVKKRSSSSSSSSESDSENDTKKSKKTVDDDDKKVKTAKEKSKTKTVKKKSPTIASDTEKSQKTNDVDKRQKIKNVKEKTKSKTVKKRLSSSSSSSSSSNSDSESDTQKSKKTDDVFKKLKTSSVKEKPHSSTSSSSSEGEKRQLSGNRSDIDNDYNSDIKHEESVPIREESIQSADINENIKQADIDVIEDQIIPADAVIEQSKAPVQQDSDTNFMIGREKDPSKSEVARLIQQSLELDRKREELRRQEQERLQEQIHPRDEVLERDHHRHQHEPHNTIEKEDENVDLDESSIEDEVEAEEKEISEGQFSEEYQAGEATPMSMPSGVDTDNSVSSPEDGSSKPVVEVFDLQESSSEDISPDMESQALFVKLKEAQCRIAVLEAELAKLKAKLIVLENAEGQKKHLERKNEEMAARLRDTEKSLTNAVQEKNQYQDMLEGSQGEYIKLEKKMSGDFTALEKKYHKAKKLIKEYQQREKDFVAERESLLQQQTEKDQQYNALVKSLKDKIFLLEGDLREAQKAAGIPVSAQSQEQAGHKSEPTITPVTVKAVKSAAPVHDSGSPLMSPLADKDSVSSESEISSMDLISPEREMMKSEKANLFESMPVTPTLDTSVHKAKAQAANNSRRPPTKQRSKSQDSDDLMEASTNKDESGLETWIKHDSDNTVKKSDVRKRKAQKQASDPQSPIIPPANTPSESEPVSSTSVPKGSEPEPLGTDERLPTPPPPPQELPQTSLPVSPENTDVARERGDSESCDSASTVSQSSYDPSKPNFRNRDVEIPGLEPSSYDNVEAGETESETSSISAKKSKGFNLPKLPFKFGGGAERDKGGVMLVSTRSLNAGEEPTLAPDGGITLISKRRLETGNDFDGASTISTISDTSSGYMVGEQEFTSYSFSGTPANEDHPSQATAHVQNQFQSSPISEWTIEHVRNWLIGIEMDKYIPLFMDKSFNGLHLVAMDSNKFKAMGISNSKDRDLLKKKVKELKFVLEKERKQQEKERKLLEKEQRAKEKEQKKLSKKK